MEGKARSGLILLLVRELKCVEHYPLDPLPIEHTGFNRDFDREFTVDSPANTGIFAFGVFSHDNEVDISMLFPPQW